MMRIISVVSVESVVSVLVLLIVLSVLLFRKYVRGLLLKILKSRFMDLLEIVG